ncbi:MAG: cytochrome c nitrite reductase small subunit [Deltaproteobacteria bacterium]|nr:cytochrome c nitrite reductase small subunit [Deltaproteobacteria bacterium]
MISARMTLVYLLVFLLIAAALGAFIAFGPPRLYARSESPEYCGSCHVMESRYEAWFHAGAHRRITCVDCHLPNDTAFNHALWKALDGGKEFLSFYTGRVDEDLRLSSRGARVLKENCLRCHTETMARVNEDRNCWECHRRLGHKQTGAMATLP